MDIVLGVSMAPTTVRMVLVEGENADGVTVEQDRFDIDTAAPTLPAAPERVVAAILGTRESAAAGGYRLVSTGVSWNDQAEAAMLRDALARRKLENVMLVSAFLAAAALAQAVGAATGYGYTALMFVEPQTTTLAVVNSADGAVVGMHQQQVRPVDAVATLAETVSGLQQIETRPDGLFVVGSDVDVAPIKRQLEALTPLPVSAPGEPELALARGAALAAAHAPLFSSSTAALAYAQDPGTGAASPGLAPDDYYATGGEQGLAYSADPPSEALPVAGSGALDLRPDAERQRTRRLLWVAGVAAIFIAGVVALVVALALGIRPHVDQRPEPGGNVAPTKQAPPPTPAAPAPRSPAPPPAAPAPPAPAPAHPAPAPAPAPPPPPPVPVPVPVPNIPGPKIPGPGIPKLPGLPGIPGL